MAKNKNDETGVILKIQKRTGCLLFVIGAAMLAFVLTDVFKSGTSAFGGSQNVVGEIAGEKVQYDELTQGVEELKVMYQGSDFDESSLREQAWNQIIQKRVIKVQHDLLGIKMGAAELKDALFGPVPDQMVVRNFTNPDTKQFDPNMLRQFIEIDMQEDEQKYSNYLNFLEKPLKEFREGAKYENMVRAGIFVTKIDAKYEHNLEEYKMSAKAVGLPYVSISDSSFTYDDNDLKKFLKANSADYQQLASRDIDFVVLNVFATPEDTAAARELVEGEKENFKESKKDSSFVSKKRTQRPFNGTYVRRGMTDMPSDIEDFLFTSDSGSVSNLVYQNGAFGLYKITDVKEDSVTVLRARHVLVPAGDDGESEAKAVLADIRSGKITFEEASKDNYDQTGSKGGDLGWVQKDGFNMQVPQEVKDKILSSSVGSYSIVKSGKGYHVLNVTDGPSKKLVQFAALERKVTPGTETDREVERLAGEIQFQAQDNKDFIGVIEGLGQNVREATKITLSNPSIPGVPDATDVARWLFNDKARVGDVSDVINLVGQDRYIIAKCTGIREEGASSLEDVRDQVVLDYVKDLKAQQLSDKLNEALKTATTPDDVAKAVNSIVSFVPVVNMLSAQVTGIGAEPIVAGTILGLKKGEVSKPIKGSGGVYVVWSEGQVQAGEATVFEENEKDVMRQIQDRAVQNSGEAVKNALKEKAKIIDKRYNFY
ncbi:MAG: peptidyl-prolyl cis-trans isomerase D [bacterium]|jgi:peptidyl-prolyl cis-trans isomerase D